MKKPGAGYPVTPVIFCLLVCHICVLCVSYLAKFHAAAHRFIY